MYQTKSLITYFNISSVKLKIDTLYDDIPPAGKQDAPIQTGKETTKLNRMIGSLKLKDAIASSEKSEKPMIVQV